MQRVRVPLVTAGRRNEIPVTVDGLEKWVTGITPQTTCDDVILSLLVSMDCPSPNSTLCEFSLFKSSSYGGIDRQLKGSAKILNLWSSDSHPPVVFTLRKVTKPLHAKRDIASSVNKATEKVKNLFKFHKDKNNNHKSKKLFSLEDVRENLLTVSDNYSVRKRPASCHLEDSRTVNDPYTVFSKRQAVISHSSSEEKLCGFGDCGGSTYYKSSHDHHYEYTHHIEPLQLQKPHKKTTESSAIHSSRLRSLKTTVAKQEQRILEQFSRIKEADEHIDNYEIRLHDIRSKNSGKDYLQESYLNSDNEQSSSEDCEVLLEKISSIDEHIIGHYNTLESLSGLIEEEEVKSHNKASESSIQNQIDDVRSQLEQAVNTAVECDMEIQELDKCFTKVQEQLKEKEELIAKLTDELGNDNESTKSIHDVNESGKEEETTVVKHLRMSEDLRKAETVIRDLFATVTGRKPANTDDNNNDNTVICEQSQDDTISDCITYESGHSQQDCLSSIAMDTSTTQILTTTELPPLGLETLTRMLSCKLMPDLVNDCEQSILRNNSTPEVVNESHVESIRSVSGVEQMDKTTDTSIESVKYSSQNDTSVWNTKDTFEQHNNSSITSPFTLILPQETGPSTLTLKRAYINSLLEETITLDISHSKSNASLESTKNSSSVECDLTSDACEVDREIRGVLLSMIPGNLKADVSELSTETGESFTDITVISDSLESPSTQTVALRLLETSV